MPFFNYSHDKDFSPTRILTAAGITVSNFPQYYPIYMKEISLFTEQVLLISAKKLNIEITLRMDRAISSIPEYRALPEYIEQLNVAFTKPGHIGVVTMHGQLQAKFIDENLLGTTNDLIMAQHEAYGHRGTLESWKRFYDAAMQGQEPQASQYETTLQKRLDIMKSWGNIAPYWVLVENGNSQYAAYPKHDRTTEGLSTFHGVYKNEISKAWNKCVAKARILARSKPIGLHEKVEYTAFTIDNITYTGHTWISEAGNQVFAKKTELRGKRVWGDGWTLSKGIFRRGGFWVPLGK